MTDSTTPQTYHITFWDNEKVFEAPATQTRKLQLTGVSKAVLNWQFSCENGTTFNNVVFNGVVLSQKLSGSYDVTMYVVANGDNTVAFNYYGSFLNMGNLLQEGHALVSLDVTAVSAGEQAPTTTYGLSNIPWWAWVIIAVVVIAAIILVLKKTGVLGAAAKLAPLAVL